MPLALLAMVLSGCHKPVAPPPPAPPAVTVVHPLERDVVDWDSYTGYVSSPQTAMVAARVSGLIVQSPFREGAIVHEGQTLFVLDPRPFQAEVDNYKAAVAQAQAQVYQAEAHFQRYEKLKNSEAISKDEYVAADAAAKTADAALAAAKAQLETSLLNLQWSHVTAPISGRVGQILVTVGNLISGGAPGATELTTIVSIDPLYCYVPVPEAAYLEYQTLGALEHEQGNPHAQVPCILDLAGKRPLPGHLDFISNSVDTGSGTVQVRGVFANPGWLIPGLFASMRIPQGPAHRAILIPQTAMVVVQNQRSVLVVNDNNVVENRNVTFGLTYGPLQSVLSGLSPGDRVIVNGVQHAAVGSHVSPVLTAISPGDLKALETEDQPQAVLPATRPATAPATENAR
jgi:RND family efflux transporter MFP subunit